MNIVCIQISYINEIWNEFNPMMLLFNDPALPTKTAMRSELIDDSG